jgi:hypothetical protein
MHRQNRRAPRSLADFRPGEKLALDFHDFEPDEEGYDSLLLIVDRVSGWMWDFYLQDRRTDTVIAALDNLIGMLERQYEVKVKVVESDNEIISKLPGVKRYLESRHIRTEPSPADTQALNGAAERAWRTIKEQIIAMRDSSKLPNALWREISKAAVYLLNRTPRKRLEWKTPFEILHSKGDARRICNDHDGDAKGAAPQTLQPKSMDRIPRRIHLIQNVPHLESGPQQGRDHARCDLRRGRNVQWCARRAS